MCSGRAFDVGVPLYENELLNISSGMFGTINTLLEVDALAVVTVSSLHIVMQTEIQW